MDYIDELVGDTPIEDSTTNEEVAEETQSLDDSNAEESSTDATQEDATQNEETDSNQAEIDAIRAEIEAQYEKRLSDKDSYINELRQQVDSTNKVDEPKPVEENVDSFWDDPEARFNAQAAKQQELEMRLAVQDYIIENPDAKGVVSFDKMLEAYNNDAEFASKTKDNVDLAYVHSYFKEKIEAQENELSQMREQIKAELLKEMGVTEQKKAPEAPPTIGSMSGSNSNTVAEDSSSGFESFFK